MRKIGVNCRLNIVDVVCKVHFQTRDIVDVVCKVQFQTRDLADMRYS